MSARIAVVRNLDDIIHWPPDHPLLGEHIGRPDRPFHGFWNCAGFIGRIQFYMRRPSKKLGNALDLEIADMKKRFTNIQNPSQETLAMWRPYFLAMDQFEAFHDLINEGSQ